MACTDRGGPISQIRTGRDPDADGIIALISGCWAEYPGIVFDLDGEVPELRTLASHFAGLGGTYWVVEAAGAIVAMIGVAPQPPEGTWEIARLYTTAATRGSGLAQRLLDMAEAPCARPRRHAPVPAQRHAVRPRASLLRKKQLPARRTCPGAARSVEQS
jgi:N-acetylglutamate synthase-like GNAT family acetyltransferase